MTSQLNVDTIVDKAGSGGTNVKISNTSVTVSDGGAVTTSTVQGLSKCFWRYKISDNTFVDSLNVSSGTDNGTGLYTVGITNAYINTEQVGTSSGFTSSGGLRETAFVSYATSSIQCTTAYQNGGGIDVDNGCCQILGGLA
tara:strand:+ start:63 stop:485 length:423 start_codon:yes stop_codon:yes gene_type:complete